MLNDKIKKNINLKINFKVNSTNKIQQINRSKITQVIFKISKKFHRM